MNIIPPTSLLCGYREQDGPFEYIDEYQVASKNVQP
jgi:hypothetical protein